MVAQLRHWLWGHVIFILVVHASECAFNIFRYPLGSIERKYGSLPDSERLRLKEDTRDMFYFGYDNYMKYAYPEDELNPILCRGRGPDRDDPSNININDILGDYSLTLIDTLDTLAILGDVEEFRHAVQLVIDNVNFDKNSTVQVFEANIRLLGALLSAHLLIEDKSRPFGNLEPEWYNGELLEMASDLASRFMPAFESSKTGLPYPRVNLRNGVPEGSRTDTCTAGAGSLLVEFGVLSRLIGDPVYEMSARRANRVLWKLRNENTGLLGNVVDVDTGKWVGELSGVGAGLDSFYEYLLKAYVLFGHPEDYYMFNETYSLIKHYMRRGRPDCNSGVGDHPLYVNVDMKNGGTHTTWIDSLQAAFAGIQVLAGDMEEAICTHALYYTICWTGHPHFPQQLNSSTLWPCYGPLCPGYDFGGPYGVILPFRDLETSCVWQAVALLRKSFVEYLFQNGHHD